MVRLSWLLPGVALALIACSRPEREPASTPLPVRQTTIDPVNARLDGAAQEADRRRQEIDNAAK